MPSRPQVPGSSVQSLSGSVPALIAEQTPFVPPVLAALHDRQVPVQGASQQTPSAQLPVVHCVARVQVCPVALSGLQFESTSQKVDATHCASDEQVPRHALAPHT